MKQDLMELDFSEQVDNKAVKIRQSDFTFENKNQLRDQLRDQISSLFAQKSQVSVNYNSMAPNEIDRILQKPDNLKLMREYLSVHYEMSES